MKFKYLLVILFTTLMQSAFAQNALKPFPPLGSVGEIEDYNQLMLFQKTRTDEQCAQAKSEQDANLQTFFAGKSGPLTTVEVNKIKSKLNMVTLRAGINILFYKEKFNRPRPYLKHKDLKPCVELEDSSAYPSGHATLARTYARILAVLFPERQFQILKRGDEVALNRVIGGVHHPSDIEAGKHLGDLLADEFLRNDINYYQLTE